MKMKLIFCVFSITFIFVDVNANVLPPTNPTVGLPCTLDCPMNSIDSVCGLRWNDFQLKTFDSECDFYNYNCDHSNEPFYNIYDGTCAEAKERYARRMKKSKQNIYTSL